MSFSSTGTRHKPGLDENSFQQLLAAAYVVQQHASSREASPLETSRILAEIAEIQSLVRVRDLDTAAACELAAERLLKMADANGISVSLVREGYLDCVAEQGVPAKIPGKCISSHSLVATEKLKAGSSFESRDARTDLCLEPGLCEALGVGALVAAPIERFGELAGLIEVRWRESRSSLEGELRACRLMAGLVSGMLERAARSRQKQEPVPQEAPAELSAKDSTVPDVCPDSTVANTVASAAASEPAAPDLSAEQALPAEEVSPIVCRVCGRPFREGESFCGFCSLPRLAATPAEDLQSKWASLWYMQQAKSAVEEVVEPASAAPESDVSAAEAVVPTSAQDEISLLRDEVSAIEPAVDLLDEPDRRWLPQWKFSKLKLRWRDAVLLAVAATLAFGLVSAWPASNSQLTWYQALVVRLGFGQPATQPVSVQGNPDAQVWVDVHTSLYYCEGSDLYGKTPDGQFTSQRSAEDSHIDSASQLPCP